MIVCRTLKKRLLSAVIWTLLSMLVFGILLVLVYAINGYVEYDTSLLTSGFEDISRLGSISGCIEAQGSNGTCSAFGENAVEQVRVDDC